MATGDVLIAEQTTGIRFVGSGFSPADSGTNWTRGSPTDVTITYSALAAAAGRQSNQGDLGATRARFYSVFAAVDFTGETPTDGNTVDYYWAPSTSGTAADGNVAGNSGADGAAGAGSPDSGITLAQFLPLCQFIGSLVLSDYAGVQTGYVGTFEPSSRYGQLIVVNNSGDAFEADNVEAHTWFEPLVDQVQ